MSKILLGVICGIIFGIISVLTMIPLKLEEKNLATTGAFTNRFAVGFVTSATDLTLPISASSLLFGLLLSLPDAIITKSWIRIMTLRAIGGVLCGLAIGAFGI